MLCFSLHYSVKRNHNPLYNKFLQYAPEEFIRELSLET
jgi:hypothetical protein